MKTHLSLLAALALVGITSNLSAQGQSLADVARKTEKRNTDAQPPKVYTNAHVKRFQSDAPAVTSTADEQPADSGKSQTETDSEPVANGGPGRNETKAPPATMREQATAAFGPTLQSVSRTADALDNNFRRYDDACYQKYSRGMTSGVSSGSGAVAAVGAAASRDSGVVWAAAGAYAWQESWVAASNISNETTVGCRMLWSDIVAQLDQVSEQLDEIDETARRAGIWPGVMRELYSQYRLARD